MPIALVNTLYPTPERQRTAVEDIIRNLNVMLPVMAKQGSTSLKIVCPEAAPGEKGKVVVLNVYDQ